MITQDSVWFSVDTVAKVFIGRTSAWLRKHMQDERFPAIHRSEHGDRQFSLGDVLLTAHALRAMGAISEERFHTMTEMVTLVTRQYARTYSQTRGARWRRRQRAHPGVQRALAARAAPGARRAAS
jgi:hypothetical protein